MPQELVSHSELPAVLFSSFICRGQYFCRDYPLKSMSADLYSDQLTQSLMVFEAVVGMCVSRESHAESWPLLYIQALLKHFAASLVSTYDMTVDLQHAVTAPSAGQCH